MVTYAGFTLDAGTAAKRTTGLVAYDSRVTPVGVRRGLDPAKVVLASPATIVRPQPAIRQLVFSGFTLRSFFDDFYNRVYLLPGLLDFGAIGGKSTKTVNIWNAFRTPVDLTAITLINGEGVLIEGQDLPLTFRALAQWPYTVTVDENGTPELDATVRFAFTAPAATNHDLRVIGTRARLFDRLLTWGDPFTVEYSFRTDIFTSEAGKETRRALRQTARRVLEFTVQARAGELRRVNQLMSSWQARPFLLPEYTRYVSTASETLPGVNDFVLDVAAPDWMQSGFSVALIYRNRVEIRRVAATSGTTLTLDPGDAVSWPAGTHICLALSGRVDPAIKSKRHTNSVAEIGMRFAVDPGTEPIVDLGTPDTEFEGREVLLTKPNWAEIPDFTYQQDREEVDYTFGRVAYYLPVEFSSSLWRGTFVGKNSAEAQKLYNFFCRMRGQCGEFYMPTWEPDIVPITTMAQNSQSIRIAGQEFAAAYANDMVHRALAVFLRDGTVLLRRVESIYKLSDSNGDDSAVQVATAWPYDIEPDDIKHISWLPVWRFATDALTVEWLTDRVAQMQFSIRSLEDLGV